MNVSEITQDVSSRYSQREAKLQETINGLNSQTVMLKKLKETISNRMQTISQAGKALGSRDRRCPLAPEHIKCGMSKDQVEAIIQQLNQEYQAARSEMAKTSDDIKQIELDLKQVSGDLEELKKKQAEELEQYRQYIFLKGQLNTGEVLINQLTKQKESLAQELAELPEPGTDTIETTNELNRLAEFIAKGEEQLVEAGRWLLWPDGRRNCGEI